MQNQSYALVSISIVFTTATILPHNRCIEHMIRSGHVREAKHTVNRHHSILYGYHLTSNIRAVTCDFQQCGILTSVGSEEPVQPLFKLRNFK